MASQDKEAERLRRNEQARTWHMETCDGFMQLAYENYKGYRNARMSKAGRGVCDQWLRHMQDYITHARDCIKIADKIT